MKKDLVRRSFDGRDPDLLDYMGLEVKPFNRLPGDSPISLMGPSRKRPALHYPYKRLKRCHLNSNSVNDLEAHVIPEYETQVAEEHLVSLALDTPRVRKKETKQSPEKQWSWKKEALGKSQRVHSKTTETEESFGQGWSSCKQLNFQ